MYCRHQYNLSVQTYQKYLSIRKVVFYLLVDVNYYKWKYTLWYCDVQIFLEDFKAKIILILTVRFMMRFLFSKTDDEIIFVLCWFCFVSLYSKCNSKSSKLVFTLIEFDVSLFNLSLGNYIAMTVLLSARFFSFFDFNIKPVRTIKTTTLLLISRPSEVKPCALFYGTKSHVYINKIFIILCI